MSGIGFSEFLILCLIGLIVLGPKRLPQVANQIGSWVGQARRMTRAMRRQLEDELDLDQDLNFKPTIHQIPNDDDSYSPLHNQGTDTAASVKLTSDEIAGSDDTDDSVSDQDSSEDPTTTHSADEQRNDA